MNDQDRDLILALAEGRLSSEEATNASARIEADPELIEELSAQRTAIEALALYPEALMTHGERTTLRADLTTRLNLQDRPAAAPVKRRVPWWQPALGIATAAVFVTAVIILPGTLSGDEAATTDFRQQALPQAPTTTAAPGATDNGVAEGGASTAPQTESAADTQATSVYSLDDLDGDALLDATRGQQDPEEMDQSLEEAGLAKSSAIDADRVAACLGTLSDQFPDGSQHPFAVQQTDDGEVLFVGVDSGEGVSSVVSISLDTCSIVDIDE